VIVENVNPQYPHPLSKPAKHCIGDKFHRKNLMNKKMKQKEITLSRDNTLDHR